MENKCKEVRTSIGVQILHCSLNLRPVCKEFVVKFGVLLSSAAKNRLRSQRHLSLTYSNIVCKVLI